MSDRIATKLSFVIIEVKETESDEIRYVLQLNKHLNGYSFFGGHIDENESPKDAVIRELKEELQIDGVKTEIEDRWDYTIKGNIKKSEIYLIEENIKKIDGEFKLPFRSLRAERENSPSEKIAEIHFFKLCINSEFFPGIYNRLNELQTAKFSGYCGDNIKTFQGETICKSFTATELVDEAWSNKDNPFIRFAIKQGIIPFPDDKEKTLPFIFNTPAVEIKLQQEIEKILSPVFKDENLDIHIIAPEAGAVKYHLRAKKTLLAILELRRTGSEKVARVLFPYPANGVFIIRSDSGLQASKWIWHPRLITKPGFWKIKKYKFKDGKKIVQEWFLASFLQGKYIEIKKNRGNDNITGKLPKIIFNPDEILSADKGEEKKPLILKEEEIDKFEEKFIKKCNDEQNKNDWLDSQDISYQRLNTYSNYLVEKYLTRLIGNGIIKNLNKSKASEEDPIGAEKVWGSICSIYSIISIKYLRENGHFHLFDPLNIVDAVSMLTSLQRYNYKKSVLEVLPAIFRQNHPSFRGFICPIESPESKKVGLTLNTAQGVMTDVSGCLFKSDNPVDDCDLGYAASLVPFYQHNDAARSMMGAKNLKQALPLYESNIPAITTGNEQAIIDIVKPLINNGAAPDTFGEYKLGIDLLVAYMPWYGWNYEDAIVANKRLSETMKWENIEEHSVYIHPDYKLCDPDPQNPFAKVLSRLFYDNQLYKKDNDVFPDTEIAFFKKESQIHPILCGGEDGGQLTEINYHEPNHSYMGGVLSWKVKISKPLNIGDKLMGRHGNKGVVSTLLSDDELPKLPDDYRLPEHLRNRAVDLVLNPHGVISRMNLGQLLETHIGFLQQFPGSKIKNDIGQAFKKVEIDELKKKFKQINKGSDELVVDENGRMKLTLPNGEKTRQPVVVGYQHFVRLNHIPERKYQVRNGGPESKNRYNLITGQPVRGRKNRGGQRIGEMEMWALAAHSASENIRSMLQTKSDPFFWSEDEISNKKFNQTFYAIKDHLFALGIDFEELNNEYSFKWDKNSNKIKKIGNKQTNFGCWELVTKVNHSCPKCNKVIYKDIVASGKVERSEYLRFSVKNILNDSGYDFPDSTANNISTKPHEGKITIKLKSKYGKSKSCCFKYKRNKSNINVTFNFSGKNHYAYHKLKTPKKGETPHISISDFIDYRITCESHKSQFLQSKQDKPFPRSVSNGLCDEKIFGAIDLEQLPFPRWGYIELPFEMKYPIKQPRGFSAPKIQYIPILPLKYRYNKPRLDQPGYGGKLTEQYVKLIKLCDVYNEESSIIKGKIQSVVNNIFNEVYRRLFGIDKKKNTGQSKFGLIRRKGLGRRVDFSGRLVIVPDPTLAWNECGVPTEVLLVLLKDNINKILNNQNIAVNKLFNIIFKTDFSENDVEEINKFTKKFFFAEPYKYFTDKKEKNVYLEQIKQFLSDYLVSNPDFRIILNRQPSLHRYSIMAFKPRPISPEEGMVLKINPLVCKGFGADFDGDEMAIHLPLTPEEHKEAEVFEPTHSNQLLSVANEKPVSGFDQDFVLGHYLLGEKEKRNELFKTLDIEEFKEEKNRDWKNEKGSKLQKQIIKKYPEKVNTILPEWMRKAFKEVTDEGISFGFIELSEYAPDSDLIEKIFKNNFDLQKLNLKLGELTIERLEELEKNRGFYFGFSSMAISGASGKVQQTRQIVSARGYLSPGDIGFEPEIKQFVFKESLFSGMELESSFYAAMNARSSMIDKKMGTPKAGALTRKMVLALWPWAVEKTPCGSDNHSIISCKLIDKNKICSECYGAVLGYDEVPNQYPAGLIAAQSIGERGTQLSMQSFHTGERVISLNDVEKIFNGKDPDNDNKNWFEDKSASGFIKRMKSIEAYEYILDRHFELVWIAIHKSNKKNLGSAWDRVKTPLSSLCGPDPWRSLFTVIENSSTENLQNPISKLILTKVAEITKQEEY